MALGYGGFTKAEAEEEGKEKKRMKAKAMIIGKPSEDSIMCHQNYIHNNNYLHTQRTNGMKRLKKQ